MSIFFSQINFLADDEGDGSTAAKGGLSVPSNGNRGRHAVKSSAENVHGKGDLYTRLGLLLGDGATTKTTTTSKSPPEDTRTASSSHTSYSSLSASSEQNASASNNTSPVSTLTGN